MTFTPDQKNAGTRRAVAHDLLVGLSVSVVTLSLSAALGVLSGRGAFAGMLSACIIAMITSLFGGTRVQCSGPTGPMSAMAGVIIAAIASRAEAGTLGMGAAHFFNLILFQAAALLLLGGLLRAGALIQRVPNVVISGFMNGIAVIIWTSQIRRLLGWGGESPEGGVALNLALAVLTFLITFLVTPALRRIHRGVARYVPAMLMALIVTTLLTHALGIEVGQVQMAAGLQSLEDLTALVGANWITGLSTGAFVAAFPFALQIAALCYIDSLLTVRIMDRITGWTSRPNQELAAQGAANALVALVGGIPGAQATERSVMSIREGATTRVAGVAAGVFAFVQFLLLQDVIGLIPEAAFSGVLFRLGWDVFDKVPVRLYATEVLRHRISFSESWLERHDEENIFVTHLEMALIVLTMVITGVVNLIAAVVLATAAFYFVQKFIAHGDPLRDLQPFTETGPEMDEDD